MSFVNKNVSLMYKISVLFCSLCSVNVHLLLFLFVLDKTYLKWCYIMYNVWHVSLICDEFHHRSMENLVPLILYIERFWFSLTFIASFIVPKSKQLFLLLLILYILKAFIVVIFRNFVAHPSKFFFQLCCCRVGNHQKLISVLYVCSIPYNYEDLIHLIQISDINVFYLHLYRNNIMHYNVTTELKSWILMHFTC